MQKYFEMVQEFEKKFRMAQASVQEEKHEILGIKVNSSVAAAKLSEIYLWKLKNTFEKEKKISTKNWPLKDIHHRCEGINNKVRNAKILKAVVKMKEELLDFITSPEFATD